MPNDTPPRLDDCLHHTLDIQGNEGSKVHDSRGDALGRQLIGGTEAQFHRRAPSDQSDVVALANDRGAAERNGVRTVRNFCPPKSVEAIRLAIEDWVRIPDGLDQQSL